MDFNEMRMQIQDKYGDMCPAYILKVIHRYMWLRKNPHFETRYFLAHCEPEQFDVIVDVWREAYPRGVPVDQAEILPKG